MGHLNILELARHRGLKHLVYASSSSVYGSNSSLPFRVEDRTDRPLSLYAATKKADELMSESYSSLFRLPMTGLRFFTVYGPWGRPDMAVWLFTKAILAGEPVDLFNGGAMRRDFTYIDDYLRRRGPFQQRAVVKLPRYDWVEEIVRHKALVLRALIRTGRPAAD
ncbi:MAG: NAD-dependent epimerase/dehydratase family protein [Pirellulaceae bacterium]